MCHQISCWCTRGLCVTMINKVILQKGRCERCLKGLTGVVGTIAVFRSAQTNQTKDLTGLNSAGLKTPFQYKPYVMIYNSVDHLCLTCPAVWFYCFLTLRTHSELQTSVSFNMSPTILQYTTPDWPSGECLRSFEVTSYTVYGWVMWPIGHLKYTYNYNYNHPSKTVYKISDCSDEKLHFSREMTKNIKLANTVSSEQISG